MVKTAASHAVNIGSNPVWVTKVRYEIGEWRLKIRDPDSFKTSEEAWLITEIHKSELYIEDG